MRTRIEDTAFQQVVDFLDAHARESAVDAFPVDPRAKAIGSFAEDDPQLHRAFREPDHSPM